MKVVKNYKKSIDEYKSQGGYFGDDHIFICCASFEKRCTSILKHTKKGNYRANIGIIYYNAELEEDISCNVQLTKNMDVLSNKLDIFCKEKVILKGSHTNDKLLLENLIKIVNVVLEQHKNHKKLKSSSKFSITIDISTFNRDILITLLFLIKSSLIDININVLYTTADKFSKNLSFCYNNVKNIMGFPGILRSDRLSSLIILSGFEGERARKLIETHDVKEVYLGIGNPATSDDMIKRNWDEQITNFRFTKQIIEPFDFASDSINDCYNILLKKIKYLKKDRNIILAPMNSKLSTISIFLLGLKYPEVQLTYCLPCKYCTKNYSKGEKNVFSETLYFKK